MTGWYNEVGSISVRLMPMGMQLLAGEWLMGARKHPLDHEGTEEGSHEEHPHGQKRVKPGRRPADAAMRTIAGAGSAEQGVPRGREDDQARRHDHHQHGQREHGGMGGTAPVCRISWDRW